MKTTLLDSVPLTPGTCEWCGKNCELEDVACCLSCEAQLYRLEAVQGRIVLRVLKRWRKHRGGKGTPGEGAMTEVARITDGFLRTDRLRREEAGAIRRRNEAEAKLKAEKVAEPKDPPPQTAAPITDRPEEEPK